MHIKDHSAAMKFFRTYDNAASKGKWKEFVDEMEFDSMLQEPRTMAQEPRMGLDDGGRIAFGEGDFVTFPIKKYSDNMLDVEIRIDPVKPGTSQHGASKTLREIFEVVGRTQGGEDLINEFKKNPTKDLFVRLRKRRKFKLQFEKEQKLPPAEKAALRKKQIEKERKWRASDKGKAYHTKIMAEQGIFPATTSEERVWRDIYNASKKKLVGSGSGRFKEASRFKIKFPKHVKINPETGLPKAVKSASGKMYVPWDKYYKDIYFYDTVTKKNIKFGGVEKWMTDNLPKGNIKYKNAVENYNIKTQIEELPVNYRGKETSLANVYKQKIANPKLHFQATPVHVNHAGLSKDQFWKTEVTTASGNNKINAILQEKSSRYKIADTKAAKNKIMKEASTEINKISGGATGIFQKKTVGIDPTPKKVVTALAEELKLSKNIKTDLFKAFRTAGIGKNCRWKKAEGGRIGFAAGGYDDCMKNAIQEHNKNLQSKDISVKNAARAKQYGILKNANKIKGVKNLLQMGRKGLQAVTGTISTLGFGPGGVAFEAAIEGLFYEHYRRKGYNDKQAQAETFFYKMTDPDRETGVWEGAEQLLEDELVGKRDEEGYLKSAQPHSESWFDVGADKYQTQKDALDAEIATNSKLNNELMMMTSNKLRTPTPSEVIEAKEQEINDSYDRLDELQITLKQGTPEQEAYVRAEEKQKALQDERAQKHWGDTPAYKAGKRKQWKDEFLEYKQAKPRYRKDKPYAFRESEIEANIGPKKGMRLEWEKYFPRSVDDPRTTEQQKWDYIYNQGGFDLTDKIGIAGGVSKMADGGIMSLKKKW